MRLQDKTVLIASIFGLISQDRAAANDAAAPAGSVSEVVITGQQPSDLANSGTKTETPLIETHRPSRSLTGMTSICGSYKI